ncbi:FAD-dependent oxidoreductase [Hoeflea sp.]|uniref:oxidoreductase n=1 Tax=Hoeflea sp. TaxID=1940281 RepID=UPI003B013535
MDYEHITRPGQVGSVEIKNRISLSPMEKNWCDRLGNPGQNYIDYYALRARHGVGTMNFEATYIDARGRGNLYQLGLWSDDNIPAHKRLNEAVQAHGCRTSAELNHGGRNCNTHRTGLQPVGPSNSPFPMVGGHELNALTIEEIAEIVGRYRQGARRAAEAGYDMITIHGAHGYLVTNFLSYLNNARTDAYGGNDENRWRFLIEVYQAMRDEVGSQMPIGVRLSAQEEMEGGYEIEYIIRLVKHLETLGLDFVDISTGRYENIETLIQPMDTSSGVLMPLARQVKAAVGIPVFGAGRVDDIGNADAIVAAGDCDFVHMGRAFHADPEILAKTLAKRQDEVVSCIACNKCCMQLFMNLPSVCTVNPTAGQERSAELRPAERVKDVMIVGGGIAGLEAARVAAGRGHKVTLYEMTNQLGGHLNVLGAHKKQSNWRQAAYDREAMARREGATIYLRHTVSPDDIVEAKPDVLILATGTRPFIPKYLPGWDCAHVTDYEEVTRGRVKPGKSVAVIGGQWLGMAVAQSLAEAGAEVTVIEATDAIAQDLEFMAQQVMNARLAKSNQISVRLNTNVERIEPDRLVVQSGGKTEQIEGFDQVVFAIERTMERDLENALAEFGVRDTVSEVYAIGDCVWPREPYDSLMDGFNLARAI